MRENDSANEDRQKSMVTVARFENPVEAQMARGMLESAGIECELVGENANVLIQSAFEAQLEVSAEDEEAARQLLEQAGEKDGIPDSQLAADPGFEGVEGDPDAET